MDYSIDPSRGRNCESLKDVPRVLLAVSRAKPIKLAIISTPISTIRCKH